jgi:hypothetical protein
MTNKINSIAIVDAHYPACQVRLDLCGEFSALNKNPGNSSKIRTPTAQLAPAPPSIPPNNSDKALRSLMLVLPLDALLPFAFSNRFGLKVFSFPVHKSFLLPQTLLR